MKEFLSNLEIFEFIEASSSYFYAKQKCDVIVFYMDMIQMNDNS